MWTREAKAREKDQEKGGEGGRVESSYLAVFLERKKSDLLVETADCSF
jgi:hypothetical protein